MPVLDILSSLDTVWEDPAWLMAILTIIVGGLGLLALLLLYPLGRD